MMGVREQRRQHEPHVVRLVRVGGAAYQPHEVGGLDAVGGEIPAEPLARGMLIVEGVRVQRPRIREQVHEP